MNSPLAAVTGPVPPDGAAPAAHVWSNRDHAALPARTLGPKAAALQARRQRASTLPVSALTSDCGIRLSTTDGALAFVLQGRGGALYVERLQRRPLGTHILQSIVFASSAEFTRWCDADPLRFEDPNLYQCLRRQGEGFFDGLR